MTTINANMTATQTFVPLAAPGSTADGYYSLGSEVLHLTGGPTVIAYDGSGDHVRQNHSGKNATRGVAGTTAATHSSGTTLTHIADPADSLPLPLKWDGTHLLLDITLPTSDPTVAGALYTSTGALKVSAG